MTRREHSRSVATALTTSGLAAQAIAEAAFQDGLEHGLRCAELIAGWLTEQPDTKRQAKIRAWAEKAIEKARQG